MKQKIVKTTFLLLIGSFIVKLLGLISKIILTRILDQTVLNNYMLLLPTFTLLINLGQFGMPIALSKLIAEEKNNNLKLISSAVSILIIINIILIILITTNAKILSINFLHNENLYISIMFMALVIPFTSISSICKSYFTGKSKHLPNILSNITEEIIKILIIIIIFPHIKNIKLKYILSIIILSNIITEFFGTIVLIYFLPPKISFKNKNNKPNKEYLKKCLSIGLYNTISRIVTNIAYFVEPIILTKKLIAIGINKNIIFTKYGVLSAYSLPILYIPEYFTNTLGIAILPLLSKEYSKNNDRKNIKSIINYTFIISSIIIIPFSLICLFNPELLLNFFYKTSLGSNYIEYLIPIFVLEYLHPIINSILIVINKSKIIMYSTIIATTMRILTLSIYTNDKYKFQGLLISIVIEIIIGFTFNILSLYYINKKKNE